MLLCVAILCCTALEGTVRGLRGRTPLLLPTDLPASCIVCPVTWRRQFGDEGIAALASLSALSRLDLMYR